MFGGQLWLMLAYADGTFPRLFLATWMPSTAPDCPTTPIVHWVSIAIFQISLPSRTCSSGGCPNARFHISIACFIGAGGSLPWAPLDWNQRPASGMCQLKLSIGKTQPDRLYRVSVPSVPNAII